MRKREAVRLINATYPDLHAREFACGEIRITTRVGTRDRKEAVAYYTPWTDDALGTAALMAHELAAIAAAAEEERKQKEK